VGGVGSQKSRPEEERASAASGFIHRRHRPFSVLFPFDFFASVSFAIYASNNKLSYLIHESSLTHIHTTTLFTPASFITSKWARTTASRMVSVSRFSGLRSFAAASLLLSSLENWRDDGRPVTVTTMQLAHDHVCLFHGRLDAAMP
jgi:hypothetical protein